MVRLPGQDSSYVIGICMKPTLSGHRHAIATLSSKAQVDNCVTCISRAWHDRTCKVLSAWTISRKPVNRRSKGNSNCTHPVDQHKLLELASSINYACECELNSVDSATMRCKLEVSNAASSTCDRKGGECTASRGTHFPSLNSSARSLRVAVPSPTSSILRSLLAVRV